MIRIFCFYSIKQLLRMLMLICLMIFSQIQGQKSFVFLNKIKKQKSTSVYAAGGKKNDTIFCLYFQEARRETYCPITSHIKINLPFSPHNFESLFLMSLRYFDMLIIPLYRVHLGVSLLRSFLRKMKVSYLIQE